MIHLTRIDPAKNMARFYALHIQRDLFDHVALIREWGRIGQSGTMRADTFDTEAAASTAAAKIASAKQRRGYHPQQWLDYHTGA